jgi:heterodisulfide reductase subunit C
MAVIRLENADLNFKYELAREPGGEKIMACFTCRTCTVSCPITPVNESFNPVRIIRMALYGRKKEVLGRPFVWLCSSCYACQERCPQGVNITEFMTLLKNMALRKGNAPLGIRALLDTVKSHGRVYPIDDFDNKKRNKIGLPSLPTSCDVVKDLLS